MAYYEFLNRAGAFVESETFQAGVATYLLLICILICLILSIIMTNDN